MKNFNLFTQKQCDSFTTVRYNLESEHSLLPEEDSQCFKDRIAFCESLENLAQVQAKYIIIGIPEDIGVRANMGRPGAHEAWNDFLTHFLNLQHHRFNDVGRFCILGTVHTADLIDSCANLEATKHGERVLLSNAVATLDKRVTAVIDAIIAARKTPIIIGGGHNNSYPILQSFGSTKPIDCINIDAHTDLRPSNGRHSGNGFSHAIKQGYLKRYFMIGIQEAYLSSAMLALIQEEETIAYCPYELGFSELPKIIQQALNHVDTVNYGLEIDMDVVSQFPASAQSPVGYTFEQLRLLARGICKQAGNAPKYIHICEAAPRYGAKDETGKALANLVNDFV
jgi:formiminoglutamase